MNINNAQVNVSIVVYSSQEEIHSYKYQILKNSIIYLENNKFINKLLIIDNSPKNYFSWTKRIGKKVNYVFNSKNLGFGRGHNLSKVYLEDKKFHLILNPDIIFDENKDLIEELIYYFKLDEKNVILQPNIVNYQNEKNQFLCKRNPTLLIQIIRGFSPHFIKKLFEKYNHFYEMRDIAYKNKVVESQYLSGCFLLCKTEALNKVKWFDEDFFMYMEDADLVRRLSAIGKCLHIPYLKVKHIWERGSHKEFKLKFEAIKSFFIYSYKWGLKIW